MRYNNIIWDLDGTLLDTLEDLHSSLNMTLISFSLPTKTIDEVRSYVGNGVYRLVELAVPGGTEHPQFVNIFKEFKKNYSSNSNNKTKAYDGVLELLAYLKEEGVRMAIVSNKIHPEVERLSKKYFAGTIEIAMGESESINKKPAPDMVYQVMSKMGINSEDTVYIGDSEVDIATANNANLDCISVAWGFRSSSMLHDAGANFIIDTVDELKQYLAN